MKAKEEAQAKLKATERNRRQNSGTGGDRGEIEGNSRKQRAK